MKTEIFLSCVMVFAVLLSANAFETDTAYSDRRLQERVEPLEKKVETLENRLAAIQKAVSNYWETGTNNMDAIQAAVRQTDQRIKDIENKPNGGAKGTIALLITIPTTLVLVAFMALAFWPKKASAPSVPQSKNKCPRCGWEHDPNDTVCKNPSCKTQF